MLLNVLLDVEGVWCHELSYHLICHSLAAFLVLRDQGLEHRDQLILQLSSQHLATPVLLH